MKIVARTIVLVSILLLSHNLIVAQVRSKKATVIYADKNEIEVTNWYWVYVEKKLGIIRNFYVRTQHTQIKEKRKTSNVLMLSRADLAERGVYGTNLEISETQISSIEFKWKSNVLEKVIVSLIGGKKIELPSLEPVAPYNELYLMGTTNVNGFEGNFQKQLNGKGKITTDKGTVVEIRFQ